MRFVKDTNRAYATPGTLRVPGARKILNTVTWFSLHN